MCRMATGCWQEIPAVDNSDIVGASFVCHFEAQMWLSVFTLNAFKNVMMGCIGRSNYARKTSKVTVAHVTFCFFVAWGGNNIPVVLDNGIIFEEGVNKMLNFFFQYT